MCVVGVVCGLFVCVFVCVGVCGCVGVDVDVVWMCGICLSVYVWFVNENSHECAVRTWK